MDRRDFLMSGAALTLAGTASAPGFATPSADPLNPPGIKTAGIKMLPVRGGKYKVWTKTIGDGPIKVLLLHGGPAATHDYLEAFESFLPPAGIQMIYYDQLGCGNSDIPDDPALWTLPGFVSELEEVRQGLGLDQFVLLGHSWGSILGIDYALQYQRHLRGLVISNMTAGMKAYLRRTAAIKDWLSPADRKRLAELEAAQDYDNADYHRIVEGTLYPQMLCRTVPWPEPVTRSFARFNAKIYEEMQGKSEFLVTGNLKDWERWDRLHEIKTRALTIGARYDEMDPADMLKMATLMPNAQGFVCPNGSHMAMWDDQAYYFDHLLAWLKKV
ncbi:MAG: proline iminopeptidase-family hydrolase [Sphingomonas sp.]|uniref:proline iminopeptidase-family hydrolase n=1 Tax=Sphingomonas sp. TaxID=28214 RepID=UPI001AC57111|nr:proline iminopeptidase-family hydrolase [Sphingomonas sp.]MBN8815650.1 proline iminopeptidase-family hydrolase [Sphingomonas sp.]